MADRVGRRGAACCAAYNDWMLERLVGTSERIKVAAMIPTWTVEGALGDLQRCAANGFAAALVPMVATPGWNHRQWDPCGTRSPRQAFPSR